MSVVGLSMFTHFSLQKAVETDVQTWLMNNGESYEVELQQGQPVLESLPDWDSSNESGQRLFPILFPVLVHLCK